MLRRSVAAESAVGVLVLAATALLVNTVPARTAFSPPAAAATGAVINGAADFRTGPGRGNSGSVTVFLEPGRAGVNILHVTVWDTDNVPYPVPEVRVSLSEPSRRIGPLPVRLTSTGPGQYIAPATQIPTPGDWRIDVAVRTTEVDETIVSFPMKIG